MNDERPKVLIAAPALIIRELGAALADGVDVLGAQTWSEAVSRLDESRVDAIIVCYAFDELRPFRLLNYLRDDWQGPHVPTFLVRALPVPLGRTQEAQVRETYKRLGVDEFFNLHAEEVRVGRAGAVKDFRDSVFAQLRLTAL